MVTRVSLHILSSTLTLTPQDVYKKVWIRIRDPFVLSLLITTQLGHLKFRSYPFSHSSVTYHPTLSLFKIDVFCGNWLVAVLIWKRGWGVICRKILRNGRRYFFVYRLFARAKTTKINFVEFNKLFVDAVKYGAIKNVRHPKDLSGNNCTRDKV